MIIKLAEKLLYQVFTCLPGSSCVDQEGVSAVLFGCDAYASSPGMLATDASEQQRRQPP